MNGAEPLPRTSFGRRFLGSFLSAVGGWLVAGGVLFAWTCFLARRQPIAPTFFDACALALYVGVFVFGTWLLVLWPLFAIVGFVVKSLFWLAILGIVLFVATGIFGAVRRRSSLR